MKKFFILFLTICLFSFTLFAADVDLSSNLTFTFEPSATAEKSLIIIPFVEPDFNLAQTDKAKKDNSLLPVYALGVALVLIFCLEQEYKF